MLVPPTAASLEVMPPSLKMGAAKKLGVYIAHFSPHLLRHFRRGGRHFGGDFPHIVRL